MPYPKAMDTKLSQALMWEAKKFCQEVGSE